MFTGVTDLTINTGNVLNFIDIKKKAGQNVTDELSESIKITLNEWSTSSQNGGSADGKTHLTNGVDSESSDTSSHSSHLSHVAVVRGAEDVQRRMAEEDRKNLKIGVKIFMRDDKAEALVQCLESVFTSLHTDSIDSVILAYNPPLADISGESTETLLSKPISNKDYSLVKITQSEADTESQADSLKCDTLMPGIKVLWQVLEDYVKSGRVSQLGIADIGDGCMRRVHAWARVRPAIAHINLASCCLVPPALHVFCRENHVQLLTHADPPDLLTEAAKKGFNFEGIECSDLDWCARYQVHIKCRGVLSLKGYVCKAIVQPVTT